MMLTVFWERRATIGLWCYEVVARQFWCNIVYCRFGLQPSCCVTLSLWSSVFSTSFDQWDSRVAAAVLFCDKACVTATLASFQATAAEDKLRQPCSTAGDSEFSQLVSEPSEVLKVWTRRLEDDDEGIDEYQRTRILPT